MAGLVRLRVLEVLATLKRAGAERVAVTLGTRLDRRRFDCEVVSLYDSFPGGFESELGDVPVQHLGKRRGFDWRMYPRLSKVIRAFRPHVIHTHSYVLRYVWPVSGRAAVVHTVHNVAEREVDAVGRLVHWMAMRRGVRFVAIGAEVAASFRRVYGADPAAVIPNGVDLRPAAAGDWRRVNGFRADDILIVSVARLDPQKDPMALIEALPNDPRCHLLLVGDGALRSEVERRAGERVRVLGSRTDIPEMLAACDIFALTSKYEGVPVAVIEAMAAGLPVAAPRVGGIPELVEDRITGFVGDVGTGLARLVGNRELREEMGERGRVRSQLFCADRMVNAYASLFEKIAENPE